MSSLIRFKRSFFRAVETSILVVISIGLIVPAGGCATVQEKKIKDSISQISFSHDGKKILFDRCRGGECQIQVYDLETGELSAYQSPPNERWTMARYSYDGSKIVFSAIPIKDGYLELADIQIAIMDPDGRNIRKITSGPGAKICPAFSHSGKKVIYARAGYIRKKGATPAAQFDAWEVDLETGREKRLTYCKYFTMKNLAYFPDDERFIFDGRLPEAFPGIKPGDKEALKRKHAELKEKNIAVAGIQVMRGTEMVPRSYSFGDIVNPSDPLMNKEGTRLFFSGIGIGGQYYLYSQDGNHRRINTSGSVDSAAISPDGEYLGIIYASRTIAIFRVQDGSRRTISLAAPTTGDTLPNRTILPEKPSLMINR
jgi:dipeptidyl aminopeptidase/acylaminoacyl peptidase